MMPTITHQISEANPLENSDPAGSQNLQGGAQDTNLAWLSITMFIPSEQI